MRVTSGSRPAGNEVVGRDLAARYDRDAPEHVRPREPITGQVALEGDAGDTDPRGEGRSGDLSGCEELA